MSDTEARSQRGDHTSRVSAGVCPENSEAAPLISFVAYLCRLGTGLRRCLPRRVVPLPGSLPSVAVRVGSRLRRGLSGLSPSLHPCGSIDLFFLTPHTDPPYVVRTLPETAHMKPAKEWSRGACRSLLRSVVRSLSPHGTRTRPRASCHRARGRSSSRRGCSPAWSCRPARQVAPQP